MIDRKSFFDQSAQNNLRTYYIIRKIATVQRDDCTTVCLLDYNYFKDYYKMIAIDLRKQQALDDDPIVIKQISFIGNLKRDGNENTAIFLLLKKQKKPF